MGAEQLRGAIALSVLATGDKSHGGPARREEALSVLKAWSQNPDSQIPAAAKEGMFGEIEKMFHEYMSDPSDDGAGFSVPFKLAVFNLLVPLQMGGASSIDAVRASLTVSLQSLETVAKALVGRGPVATDITWLVKQLTPMFEFFYKDARSAGELVQGLGWLGYYLTEELPFEEGRDAALSQAEEKFREVME